MGKAKGIWNVLLVVSLVLVLFTGCTKNNNAENVNADDPQGTQQTTKQPETDSTTPDGFSPIPEDVQDSSELPDWTGKTLSLKVWFDHGTGGTYAGARKYKDDVVTKEIERVTGVHIDLEHSYDNGGNTTGAVKLGMIAATNDWPDLIINGNEMKTLVENDKIYDLTDLIPQYMPNVMNKIPQSLDSVWSKPYISMDGKAYAVPAGIYNNALPVLYPDIDASKYPQPSPYGNIWVRDDVLKMLYPDAKSQQEIQDLYVTNGKFTEDDILDVPIQSEEDFIQFLYNVQELHLKEGNQEIAPIYTFSGQDNWSLMTGLFTMLNGSYSSGGNNNYFTYWDKQTKQVEWMFKQPEFKDLVKEMNVLLRDGVASKEAMVDPYNVFQQKLNNGLYAVSYIQPDNTALEKAGKAYRYRKVYLDIPFNKDRFILPTAFPDTGTRIQIVKGSVSEEDLPQVLRWIDFLESDAGEKLWYWGPKSAGLFTEQDGMRVYKDKALEDQMVYLKPGTAAQQYGLEIGDKSNDDRSKSDFITFMGQGRFDPINWYPDKQLSAKDADTYFDMSRTGIYPTDDTTAPKIYSYVTQVPEADEAWKKRADFENALTKTLVAKDDAEFEKLWNDFLSTAEKDGYTDGLKDKIDAAFRETNAQYMDNI
ncbi:hypothetical protein [Paenibacillus sp. HB172176]|uniref:hypothetical protein n=1 Tax=Paenibacillus sp. HB172176 TaxID=2493690 RepID=UPI00143BED96|nr:hypothetical protein [Paenibacillus sp. HB172176]